MSLRAGKTVEKVVTEELNLKRGSITNGGNKIEDVRGVLRFVDKVLVAGECKYREYVPKIITDMIEQARSARKNSHYIPIGFLRKKRAKVDDIIVVMTLQDFKRMLK